MSAWTLAQKPVKSSKDLANRFIGILQSGSAQNLKSISPSLEVFKLFASSSGTQEALDEQYNYAEGKLKTILDNIQGFALDAKKLQFKSLKESKILVVSQNYYALQVIVNYQTTTDTLILEAFKDKKNWYLVDISNEDADFNSIYQKHAQYTAKQYYDLAITQINEEKYDDALKNLGKSDFLSPKNKEVFYQKGLIYKKKNDKFKAQEMFRTAIFINSEFAPAYFESALLGMDDEEYYYEAISNFEYCMNNDYQSHIAAKHLVKIHRKELDKAEEQEYNTEENLKYYYDKLSQATNKALEKEEELNNEEKAFIYYQKALCMMMEDKHKEAQKDFEKVISFDSKNHKALYELSWLENEFGNFKKSLEYAQKAYDLEKDPEYLAEMAFAKKNLGDYKGAIEHYNTLFSLGEQHPTAKKYQNRGDCYKALKNNKMACADYKKAIELGGEDKAMQDWMKKNCK
ncbi:hypothetical protein AD998_05105 [bacterium 336/3]|nr:hypothetical protein AD998_05105 [bacterium 336/3]